MSKRGQNEGSIFEEKPGRWVASLSLGYEVKDGKRRRLRKKFTATSRREVQKKLTEALREQQTGGTVPIQKDTLGPFLKVWLASLEQNGRKESTVASYRWLIEKYIEPDLGRTPLTKLTQRDLNEFMGRKLEDGLSARTVGYCHAVIRSALTRAEKDGLVGRNVAKLASPPHRASDSRVEPLTLIQANALLAAVAGHRLEALYSVALAIGLRRGEALGLAWTDIDIPAQTLTVRSTLQRIKYASAEDGETKSRLVVSAPKTQKSGRLIPLPSFAVESLQRHRERQAEERKFAGEQWTESGLVFASTVGTPLEPRNVVRHYHGILALVKIPRHRFHDLRHTAASLLLAQGATLHDVKEILGHSQITLTANLYGHAYTSVLRESVDRVGSLLGSQNPVAPSVAPSEPKSNRRNVN
jgi:integrase